MEFALINFRVKPRDRQQLRVALLQKGQTLQDFFADVVERELASVGMKLKSTAVEGPAPDSSMDTDSDGDEEY